MRIVEENGTLKRGKVDALFPELLESDPGELAHGKTELTKQDVEKMIRDVRDFLAQQMS